MSPNPVPLTTLDHDRNSAGLLYVYPVVSRRAGGVSIGINLNVNNACNWRCIYCQVPDLVRGSAPSVDLARLRRELGDFLQDVLHGDFMSRRVAPEARRLNDIAISGNGEPTSAKEFEAVVDLIGEVRAQAGVPAAVKTVLITNGSLMGQARVRAGVAKLRGLIGEVWFKADRAPGAAMRAVNGSRLGEAKVLENLAACVALCPTWLQTCMFATDGVPPGDAEIDGYLAFLKRAVALGIRLEGVLLYSFARPSLQPEAARLAALPLEWLEGLAKRIRAAGLAARVTP